MAPKKKSERKLKQLTENITAMKNDGRITMEAYDNLIGTLDDQMPSVSVWRTEIPSEIAPPVLEDELVSIPPSAAEVVAEDEPVPVSGSFEDWTVEPEAAVAHHCHLAEALLPPTELDPEDEADEADKWSFMKKNPKKSWKKNSMSEGWTKVKQPTTIPEVVLDEPKAEERDRTATMADSAIESQPEAMEGCLFVNCIRCTSAIMVKFHNKLLPKMPNTDGEQHRNAVTLTLCKTCEIRGVDWFAHGSQDQDVLVNHFKDVKLSVSMVQGSDVMKAARLITDIHVPMLTNKGGVVFVKRDLIMEKVASMDTMASVDMTAIHSLDPSELLLPHLSGGFI